MAAKSSSKSASRGVPAKTPGQSAAIKQMTGLATAYAALAMTLKAGWQAAANALNARQGRTGRQKLCAANVYVSINSARRACAMPDTDSAPTDFSLPVELPSVQVTATAAAGRVPFGLTLFCAGYATAAVCVEAANGVAAGKPKTPDSGYAVLTMLTDGLDTINDITSVYSQVWGDQEEGAQIAIRLTAVSAAGIWGVPYEVTGVVALAGADGLQKAA